MLRTVVQALLLRELAAVRRSVEAYPDEESLWLLPPGLPNAGGTLVLHVAGNLQHYVGARLGASQTWRLVAQASSASWTWNLALGNRLSDPAWS